MSTSKPEPSQERLWRGGKLPPDQLASLRSQTANDPEARTRLEEDIRLNQLLDTLPLPQLTSNFTSQVLAEAAREHRQHRRRNGWLDTLVGVRAAWIPRLALGGITIAVATLLVVQRSHYQDTELAKAIAPVSGEARLPEVDALLSFEEIMALDELPPVDLELLAALD